MIRYIVQFNEKNKSIEEIIQELKQKNIEIERHFKAINVYIINSALELDMNDLENIISLDRIDKKFSINPKKTPQP